MKLTFSQGIVGHSTVDGTPSGAANFWEFAAGPNYTKIQLVAPADQPFQLAFAHRDTNYLITIIDGTNIDAWGYGSASSNNGPFSATGGPYYLWVGLDSVTGQVEYGYSAHEPQSGATPPYANSANRPNDQHWYDTTNKVMKVWNKSVNRWIDVIRVFVAKYSYGAPLVSLSANYPSFLGTTGRVTGVFNVGSLIYDANSNPVKRTLSNNVTTFFTTEDNFTTILPTGARARYETFLVDAIAVEPIAAYSPVGFNDFGRVSLLSSGDQNSVAYGIIETAAGAAGDLVQVVVSGQVRNASWNWSTINQQIFVDKDNPGNLVTVEDDGYAPSPGQPPFAVVVDTDAILLSVPNRLQQATTVDHGGLSGLEDDDHPQYLNNTRGDNRYYTKAQTYTQAQVDSLVVVNLGELSDVNLASAGGGEVLVLTEGSPQLWENQTLVEADIASRTAFLAHTNNTSNPHSTTLASLTDVDLTGSPMPAATGDVLLYTDSAWSSKTLILNDIADVDVGTGSPLPEVGEALVFDGTYWRPSSMSLDTTYLRLDVTNDPLTSTLTINGGGSPALALILTGDLLLSGNDIVSVGTVDGVDVSLLETNFTSHVADSTIHFTEASIDHTAIQNVGTNTHAQIDTHIADSTIHFTKDSINLDDLQNVTLTSVASGEVLMADVGSPGLWINRTLAEADIAAKSDFDSHTGDGTIHFTEASIDHTAIQNVGTNTHAQIDTHIADSTIHFTEASIDHTAIQNVGTNTHAQIDTHIADSTIHFTKDSINLDDLGNVDLVGSPEAPVDGDVLTYNSTTSTWQALTPAPSSGPAYDTAVWSTTSMAAGDASAATASLAGGSPQPTGTYNTIFGYGAGATLTTETGNTIIGSDAMASSTGVVSCVAIGQFASRNATSVGSTSIGYLAGFNSGSSYPINIGYEAGRTVGGNYQIAIGYQTLYQVSTSTAERNIAVGYRTGDSLTTGSDNILIGANVNPTAATTSNEIRIGNRNVSSVDPLFVEINGEETDWHLYHFNGAIEIVDYAGSPAAPTITTDKLYNVGGDLYWNGAVVNTGSISTWSVQTVTSGTYNVQPDDDLIVVDAQDDVTIILHAADDNTRVKPLNIKRIDSHAVGSPGFRVVSVVGLGGGSPAGVGSPGFGSPLGETIDGDPRGITLDTQYENVTLAPDNVSAWYVI